MIYSLLIYEAPRFADARSPAEREAALVAHRELQADSKAAGSFRAATQLAESGGSTVQQSEGTALVTDAPFAETKELFIGCYLVECGSLDDALVLAKRIPISPQGRVDVRPAVWTESRSIEPE